MPLLGFVLVSFTPGLFWLWFFLRLDRFRPAPRRLVSLAFLLGMLSTVPAGLIEAIALDESALEPGATLAALAMAMLLVVGPVEELSKFAAVRLGAFRSQYFEEPMDGLVYAAAASLGFASLENLGYVLSFGPAVMILRAPLSTVAHLVFGSLWGYGLGQHQRSGRTQGGLVIAALIGAAVLHAAFNLAVFIWLPAAILLVALGGLSAYRGFQWGQRTSPFRYRRNYPLSACTSCGQLVRVTASFCPHCGVPVTTRGAALVCGNCKQSNRPDALYCTDCGDRLLR